MKKFFSKEILIAVTVIISLVVLYWGIEYLKGINMFKPANFYYVMYKDVKGLTIAAPVTINGYQVGQVREINYNFGTNGEMEVLLSLDKNLKVPVGTQAFITSDLLGVSQISLHLSGSSTYYNVGDKLIAGEEKGLMDDVRSKVLPSVYTMMPKIDSILTNINAILSNPALNASISRLDGITANLDNSSRQLSLVMSNQLPGIVSNVGGVSHNLKAMSGNLNELSQTLKALPIDSTMRNIHSTTANLKTMSDKLNNANSSLGKLLNDDGLYMHADKSLTNLDSLLQDVRLHPKRYINVKVF
ncbi:MAG: MlaD family protein [Muribaculaceae bacterium]|jgi:phospholipid/cholesterol/gamma-HCH transport system substrate-binding protein|nr:MlaD family protein [Muribaculaceae bacterium]